MDPARRYHLTSGVTRREPPRPSRTTWLLGALGRIGAMSLAASFVGVPLAFFLAPVPAGADGVTFCFPGIGPVQQLADDMDHELEEVVRIHELMHVQQCRSLGATAWYLTYGTRQGRIQLEAEAYCAEVDFLARRGADRETLLEPRVEILHAGYGNDGSMSLEQVRALMRATCGLGSGGGQAGG